MIKIAKKKHDQVKRSITTQMSYST